MYTSAISKFNSAANHPSCTEELLANDTIFYILPACKAYWDIQILRRDNGENCFDIACQIVWAILPQCCIHLARSTATVTSKVMTLQSIGPKALYILELKPAVHSTDDHLFRQRNLHERQRPREKSENTLFRPQGKLYVHYLKTVNKSDSFINIIPSLKRCEK